MLIRCIFRAEVLNEQLMRFRFRQPQLIEEILMPEISDEGAWIAVTKRAELCADVVDDRSPQGNFDSLDCVQKQKPQLPIESVQDLDVVEVRARPVGLV